MTSYLNLKHTQKPFLNGCNLIPFKDTTKSEGSCLKTPYFLTPQFIFLPTISRVHTGNNRDKVPGIEATVSLLIAM